MKVFIGSVATETNPFSPLATGRDEFEDVYLSAIRDAAPEAVKGRDVDLVFGDFLFAMPSGRTVRADYEAMRDALLAQLAAAAPVDAVMLPLHGAMMAYGCDDCEGDIAARARELIGPKTPLILCLDPHAHLTQKMTHNANAIVFYKEWPHTDVMECMLKCLDIAIDAAAGRTQPVMAVWDCRMGGMFPTQDGAMKDLVSELRALEKNERGVLAATLCHGFPFADIPDMGAKAVIVADGDETLARQRAEAVGRKFFSIRESVSSDFHDLKEGVAAAMIAAETASGRPVIIADAGDMPAGGAAGDNASVLRELMKKNVEGVALAHLWDPVAVDLCFKAGAGAKMDLRLGGFASPLSGAPLDLFDAEIVRVIEEFRVEDGFGDASRGRTALVRAGGALIGVSEQRLVALHHSHFTALGVDPKAQRILIVKSANNYHAGFDDIVADHVRISYPGVTDLGMDAAHFPNVKRPFWPFDGATSAEAAMGPF